MIQNEIAISVQNLTKSYKNLRVLEGVDFKVKKGSIFALLGSNGAGKTTIVKILTTLLKQDSGIAIVYGIDVTSNPRLYEPKICRLDTLAFIKTREWFIIKVFLFFLKQKWALTFQKT